MAAISAVDARVVMPDVGHRQRRCIRRTRPARFTPTPWVSAHRCRRPARQLRQRPQTTCPSPLTISPGWKSLTFEPTATISPTNSCPMTIGTGIVCLRPGVPFVDVQVGAADAGLQHADQHVVDARLGHRNVFQPQARLGFAFHSAFMVRRAVTVSRLPIAMGGMVIPHGPDCLQFTRAWELEYSRLTCCVH